MTEPLRIAAAPLDAVIAVAVADPALASALGGAIARALRSEIDSVPPSWSGRVIRLRTRKRLAALGSARIEGAIVVVHVTKANARRLPELVDAIRGAGAAGVQLVWDGLDRRLSEAHVFTVLERARATPGGPPVVLAAVSEPTFALRVLVAKRLARSETGNESRT